MARSTKILNARGTFTPLGVSRSPTEVQEAVAKTLGQFVLIEDLQLEVDAKSQEYFDGLHCTVTHCASAGITVAIAASISGDCSTCAQRLPWRPSNMFGSQQQQQPSQVGACCLQCSKSILPNAVPVVLIHKDHVVNYGHSILQDIFLVGAVAILLGHEGAGKQEEDQLPGAPVHPLMERAISDTEYFLGNGTLKKEVEPKDSLRTSATQDMLSATLENLLSAKRRAEVNVVGLLLVSSRLVPSTCDFSCTKAAAFIKNHNQQEHRKTGGVGQHISVIVDGAAQDMRLHRGIVGGDLSILPGSRREEGQFYDFLVCSGQKYLEAPTSGLIFTRLAAHHSAAQLQEKAMARCMKPTKESLAGVLAAFELRSARDWTQWMAMQERKNQHFVNLLADKREQEQSTESSSSENGVSFKCELVPDVTGLPFQRVKVEVEHAIPHWDASKLVATLRNPKDPAAPQVWLMDGPTPSSFVVELVPLSLEEVDEIVSAILAAMPVNEQ